MNNSIQKIALWTISVLLSLTLLTVLFYNYYTGMRNLSIQSAGPSQYFNFTQLGKINSAFADGMQYLRSGQFAQAENSFRQALASGNAAGEAQVKNMLATALMDEGKYTESITTFQSVADNNAYNSAARAYALMLIADMPVRFSDPVIKKTIFNDAYFAQYVVAGNDDLTYRNMFEAASALYPYPLSEVSIAQLRAKSLLKMYQGANAVPSDVLTSEVKLIKDKLAFVDQAAVNTGGSSGALLGPEVLLKKAITLGYLARMHQGSPSDAETAFQQAQASHVQVFGQPSTLVDIRYALFLSKMFGAARDADIKNLLADIYTNTDKAYVKESETFFKNQQQNDTEWKASLAALAAIDPKFKSFLMGLGWTASDFK